MEWGDVEAAERLGVPRDALKQLVEVFHQCSGLRSDARGDADGPGDASTFARWVPGGVERYKKALMDLLPDAATRKWFRDRFGTWGDGLRGLYVPDGPIPHSNDDITELQSCHPHPHVAQLRFVPPPDGPAAAGAANRQRPRGRGAPARPAAPRASKTSAQAAWQEQRTRLYRRVSKSIKERAQAAMAGSNEASFRELAQWLADQRVADAAAARRSPTVPCAVVLTGAVGSADHTECFRALVQSLRARPDVCVPLHIGPHDLSPTRTAAGLQPAVSAISLQLATAAAAEAGSSAPFADHEHATFTSVVAAWRRLRAAHGAETTPRGDQRPPCLAIVIEDVEGASPGLVCDLVLALADHRAQLPCALVMSMSTQARGLAEVLSARTLSLLSLARFQLSPPLARVEALLRDVLLSGDPHTVHLGHAVAAKLNSVFMVSEFAPGALLKALDAAVWDHFQGNDLARLAQVLLDGRDAALADITSSPCSSVLAVHCEGMLGEVGEELDDRAASKERERGVLGAAAEAVEEAHAAFRMWALALRWAADAGAVLGLGEKHGLTLRQLVLSASHKSFAAARPAHRAAGADSAAATAALVLGGLRRAQEAGGSALGSQGSQGPSQDSQGPEHVERILAAWSATAESVLGADAAADNAFVDCARRLLGEARGEPPVPADAVTAAALTQAAPSSGRGPASPVLKFFSRGLSRGLKMVQSVSQLAHKSLTAGSPHAKGASPRPADAGSPAKPALSLPEKVARLLQVLLEHVCREPPHARGAAAALCVRDTRMLDQIRTPDMRARVFAALRGDDGGGGGIEDLTTAYRLLAQHPAARTTGVNTARWLQEFCVAHGLRVGGSAGKVPGGRKGKKRGAGGMSTSGLTQEELAACFSRAERTLQMLGVVRPVKRRHVEFSVAAAQPWDLNPTDE
ncbi:unnamed protein product [Pedinophyceae sp. YPF-701]|nr:unnamed protein product [Pedinophyceae sp. YPF-701]